MTFYLITIFPEIFNSYFKEGILGRAIDDKKVFVKIYNLRDFATNKHKTVDDTPCGGGPGMVLKPDPIFYCLEKIKGNIAKKESVKIKILLTSARGSQFTQQKAAEFKDFTDIIIVCGRYEGVDQRVAEFFVDEEISVGQYILTGGELPAMIIVDAVSRLLTGVLGNKESLDSESYQKNSKNSLTSFDYPVYTKPAEFNDLKVPEVLLSGNHQEIESWREQNR